MYKLLATVAVIFALCAAPAQAEPDEEFSRQHVEFVKAKVAEYIQRHQAVNFGPRAEQLEHEGYCWAILMWKLANPGGEAKLTLDVLLAMRGWEVLCGQRMRRAPPAPGETLTTPPRTFVPIPSAQNPDEGMGAAEAIEDYGRWHPGEPIVVPPGTFGAPPLGPDGLPPPGWAIDPYRGGLRRLPPEGWRREPYEGTLTPDPDAGSVDPLAPARWNQARQPIEIGTNDEVGSGARRRDQAIGAAAGLLSGVLGGGGGGRDREGPQLRRCRVDRNDMARFESNGVTLGVAARREGDVITVYAEVLSSPDSGTFQAIALDNQFGQMRAPDDVGVCDLYGEWRLSVSWSRTTYRDGAIVARNSGGSSQAGGFTLPGLGANGDRGLWRQLGFSNASHGARRIVASFRASSAQVLGDGAVLIVHVTRPGQDPVDTAPFSLMLHETQQGFEFHRCP